jgi:hypothetical protein
MLHVASYMQKRTTTSSSIQRGIYKRFSMHDHHHGIMHAFCPLNNLIIDNEWKKKGKVHCTHFVPRRTTAGGHATK